MLGNMMDRPLLISNILEYAARYYTETEIISRRVEGDIHRYTYGEACQRIKQLANALGRLEVKPGNCIGTLAWNHYRHLELYYAISGIGAITHTINPRLFPEQIAYIIDHAQDGYLFTDLSFVTILEGIAAKLSHVRGFVILTDEAHMPQTTLPGVMCYETLLAQESSEFEWPVFSENTASALCYTSGTTGNPKGALYSHRSTVLHALSSSLGNAFGFSTQTIVMPVVPMFHVCAWGTPYSTLICGSKLVFPGPAMDGKSLYELIEAEKVSFTLGVPTVWLGLLNYLNSINQRLHSLETVVIGGAAAPLAIIQEFEEKHGVHVLQGWGMTEMSPLGTVCSLSPQVMQLPIEERYKIQTKQGRMIYGMEIKVVDVDNQEVPHDGKSTGRLLVKSAWTIQSYFNSEDRTAFEEGWFSTGDMVTLDAYGYMQVVDRAKDLIKSGGEWISSIELENIALSHPAVRESCVIGTYHPKWDERPLLFVILQPGVQCTEQELLEFIGKKTAKWWVPDKILFVNELPHTATGKLHKLKLREQYRHHLFTP